MIAGGLHMVVAKDPDIDSVAVLLRGTYKADYIAPGHCTGEPTFAAFKQAFGERYLYAGLGTSLAFGKVVRAISRSDDGAPLVFDERDAETYRPLANWARLMDDDESPTLAGLNKVTP